MTPVRGHDDEVRIIPTTNSNDLDPLAPKGMMRMSDGDKSRRRLGRRGSALWVSQRMKIKFFNVRC